MKKTILSLFFLATLGITSCSSDSNSESSVNPNDLLVVAFKATGEGTNIENFARDKAGTKVLSLDGQPSSVSFTNVTITKNGVNSNSSFTIQGTNVTTKDNTPVGEYTISYKITNGPTTTEPTEQTFTVFHNENKTFDGVVATVLTFTNADGYSGNTSQTFTINGVPYQYLGDVNNKFQLCENGVLDTSNNFFSTEYGGWRIVKLSQVSFSLPPSLVTNRNIRFKQKNNIKYLELRVNWIQSTNTLNFDSTKNNCNWSDYDPYNSTVPSTSDGVSFGCVDIY